MDVEYFLTGYTLFNLLSLQTFPYCTITIYICFSFIHFFLLCCDKLKSLYILPLSSMAHAVKAFIRVETRKWKYKSPNYIIALRKWPIIPCCLLLFLSIRPTYPSSLQHSLFLSLSLSPSCSLFPPLPLLLRLTCSDMQSPKDVGPTVCVRPGWNFACVP